MKVSIIIPTFNRGHLIGETLESIWAQSYENWECIIVDDGSTDNTEQILHSYLIKDSRFKFFKRPDDRQKGANACRNIGLEESSGDLINWLDSDDLLAKHHCSVHVGIHQKHAEIDASISKADTFKKTIGDIKSNWSNIQPETNTAYQEMITRKISWPTPGVAWKREILKNRPFEEQLWSSQEWTFHVTQLVNGITFKIIDEVSIHVRRHEVRVGKSTSPEKSKSSFLSRYLVYTKLRRERKLCNDDQYHLLRVMFQAVKGTVREKYDKVIWFQMVCLTTILGIHRYTLPIIKLLILSIPIYRISGKGERLFTLKKR